MHQINLDPSKFDFDLDVRVGASNPRASEREAEQANVASGFTPVIRATC